jgi:hypothetical protein
MSRSLITPADKNKQKRNVQRYDVTTEKQSIEGGTQTNVLNLISSLIAGEEFEEINLRIRRNRNEKV